MQLAPGDAAPGVLLVIRSPTEKTTLTEYDRQLIQGVPLLLGKELVLETAATAAQQKLPHGLGRAYRGAIQLCSTAACVLIIADPTTQSDADTNVTFTDAGAAAGTTKVWIWVAPLALCVWRLAVTC